jgi:hypothetical protein
MKEQRHFIGAVNTQHFAENGVCNGMVSRIALQRVPELLDPSPCRMGVNVKMLPWR